MLSSAKLLTIAMSVELLLSIAFCPPRRAEQLAEPAAEPGDAQRHLAAQIDAISAGLAM